MDERDVGAPFAIAGRRLGRGAYVAALVASFLLLIARRPQAVTDPNLWAEDGQVFLRAALLEPWHESIFDPYAGYLHLGLRVWAEFTTVLPLSALALLFGLLNLALFPVCLSVVLSRRLRWLIPSDAVRAGLYLVLLLMPGMSETLGNLTNALWPIGIGLLLLSFCDEPRSRGGRVGELVALAIGGVTGATTMLLVPGFALRWWRQRTRHNVAAFGVVFLTAALQGILLLLNPRGHFGLDPEPRTLPRAFVLRIWGLLGVGEQTLADHVLHRPAPAWVLVLCAAGIALTVAALMALPWIVRLHVAAIFGISVAATAWAYNFNVKGLSEGPGGGRYFLIPVVLVLLTVFAAASTPAWRRAVLRYGVLAPAAGFLLFAIWVDLGLPALPKTHWARTAACIERHQPCEVVVNPKGWNFELPPVP